MVKQKVFCTYCGKSVSAGHMDLHQSQSKDCLAAQELVKNNKEGELDIMDKKSIIDNSSTVSGDSKGIFAEDASQSASDQQGAPQQSVEKTAPPKKKGNRSWKPSGLLNVKVKKDRDIKFRWTRRDNIDKRLDEGWEMANPSDIDGVVPGKSIQDGERKDARIQKRELVLMKMDNDLIDSRNQHYKEGQMSTKKMKQKFQQEAGGETYGDIIEE